MLNTPSNLSFKFGAKFVEIDKKLTLAWSAISALTDRVNNTPAFNIDAELDALNSKITANTEDITEIDSTKADTSYVDSSITTVNNSIAGVSSRVTTNINNISSLDTNLNNLTTRVTANDGNISTLNTNLNNLTTRVTANDGNISTLNTNLNDLTTRVTANEGNIEKYGEWIDNLVSSVAYDKANPFDDFYKHLFDMIYPIGSIYTTVTETPPPNIYDMSGAPYAVWVLLETGIFLRNTQDSNALGTTGGTETTQLPEHTHTTNVTINGKLYSASALSTGSSSLINCTLFAPSVKTEEDNETNVFSNSSSVNEKDVNIHWNNGSSDVKAKSRTGSSVLDTSTYFPIELNVDKDYDTIDTAIANAGVELIAGDSLPDNCPPFMYVKMYKRVSGE